MRLRHVMFAHHQSHIDMKSFHILPVLCFFISIQSYSQTDTAARYYAGRYLLDIPKEWEKAKLLDAITEILPQTFDEYIDSSKKFCLDCKTDLIVSLMIQPAVKVKGKEMYQFSAALGLFDTSGKELMELSLISPEEKHQIKVRLEYKNAPSYNYNSYNDNRTPSNNNVTRTFITGPRGNIVGSVRTAQPRTYTVNPPRIVNNIPTSRELSPSILDLMFIAEKRIYEIQEILENLKKPADPAKD
jgi:hypothetical protein